MRVSQRLAPALPHRMEEARPCMFDFFKLKHRRKVERTAKELKEGFAKVCNAMNVQLDMLMFFDGKQRDDF